MGSIITQFHIGYNHKRGINFFQNAFASTAFAVLFSIFSFTTGQAQCLITLTPTNVVNPSCGGSDGRFAVQVSGISAPYQYVLSKDVNGTFVQQESGTLIAGTPTFLFLSAGTYLVDITQGACSQSVTVTLEQAALTLTPQNIRNPTCGGSDGSFSVQVGGIVAPYAYKLFKDVNGTFVQQESGTLIAGTPTFVFLTAGTYRVDISKNGCNGSVTVVLQDPPLTLTPQSIRNPTCGGSDGSFSIQVGGIVAPYAYKLFKDVNGTFVQQESGTLIAGNPTFVFLTAGTYRLDISKGSCTGSVTVVLQDPPLTLTPQNIRNPTCGGSDGSFSVQVGGIVAPYPYKLFKDINGTFVQQESGTLIAGNPTFVFLTAGTYRLDISKGSCTGSVTVVLQEQTLTLTPTNIRNPTCGGNDGSFSVQVGGIVAPYPYKLFKDVNGTFVEQESGTLIAGTPTFVFLTAGTYRVDISKGSCNESVTVILNEPALTLTPTNIIPPSCGGNDGSFQVQTGGIVPPYQVVLLKNINGTFVQQETSTLIAGTPTFVGLSEGIYRVDISKGATCAGNVTVYMFCEVIGREGCSPGYWKLHPEAWVITNFSPDQTLESIFNVPDALELDNVTLLQALQAKDGNGLVGAAKILLRAATAALLNAAHRDVDYPINMAKIISDVNAALASGNRNTILKLASTLDKYNNLTCPIDAHNTITERGEREDQVIDLTARDFQLKGLPNPSSSSFTIQVQTVSVEKISLRVLDIHGRLIEQRQNVQPNQSFRIGDNYRPGVYLVEVQQGELRKHLRLLKISH